MSDDPNIIKRLQNHINKLEVALERLGFADVVEKIEDEIKSKYQQKSFETWTNINPNISNPNPLMNETIIRHLSPFLDFQTLQSARLVNSTWNSTIIAKDYVHRAQLSIKGKGNVSWEYWSFKDFLECFPTSSHKAIRLPLKIEIPYVREKYNIDALVLWLKTYGSRFTSMKCGFRDDVLKFTERETVPSMNFARLTSEMPNLTELAIQRFEFDKIPTELEIPCFVNLKSLEIQGVGLVYFDKQVLKSILKLTTKLKYLTFGVGIILNDIIEFLSVCHSEGYLAKLDELNLLGQKMGQQVLTFLTSVRFNNLKKLCFSKNSRFEYEDMLVKPEVAGVFYTLQNTLEELEGGVVFNVVLTKMTKLKKLQGQMSYFPEENIDFVNRLPRLETLDLSPVSYWYAQYLFDRLFPSDLQNLQHLVLKNLDLSKIPIEESQLDSVGRLVTCFPSIQVLSISTNSVSNFRILFTELTKLNDLKILTFTCGAEVEHQEVFNQSLSEEFPNFFSLQKCVLTSTTKSLALTQPAFTMGFMKAPSLKNLQLQGFMLGAKIEPILGELKKKGIELKLLHCYCPIVKSNN